MRNHLSVLIIDDHQLILEGLKNIVNSLKAFNNIVTATTYYEGKKLIQEQKFDLVITDIQLPDKNGVSLCETINKTDPATKILVITQFSDLWIIKDLLKLNVKGIVLKGEDNNEINKAIKQIISGDSYFSIAIQKAILGIKTDKNSTGSMKVQLTPRELEILNLIIQEYTNQEIAEKLFLSLRTVETHRSNLLLKFGTKNTAGLVKKAYKMGFIG